MVQLINNQLYNALVSNRRQFYLAVIFLAAPAPLIFFMLSVMITGNMIGIDEKSNIDSLYCSLPLTRAKIVNSRYAAVFLVFLILLAFTVTVTVLSVVSGLKDYDILKSFTNTLLYAFIPLSILISVILPVHFKLGGQIEKSIRYMFVVVIAVVVLIALGVFVIFTLSIDLKNAPELPLYATLTALVFIVSSFLLSHRFYKRREL